jgi:hypothetical protein
MSPPFSCRTKQPWDVSIRRMRSSAQLRVRQWALITARFFFLFPAGQSSLGMQASAGCAAARSCVYGRKKVVYNGMNE